VNAWERIKRFWATPAKPDHPLSEEEREQVRPANIYDESADAARTILSHGDPDVRGKLD
jgi:hypothetical protein